MNRSLEALAIFVICLGGILAVVRFSTSEQTAASRNVADRAVSPAAPVQGSSSAAEQRMVEPAEPSSDDEPVTFDYAQGCGLDRDAGHVYPPQTPLLSQREIALRAIRSEPWPLLVLTDPAGAAEEIATGYDPDYDAAMASGDETDEMTKEVSRRYTEAEYAAAELAAAREAATDNTWHVLTGQLASLRSWSREVARSLDAAYSQPTWRAIETRWSESNLPALFTYPRAKSEARRQLLLRQRAAAGNGGPATGQITWDDYLSFAERHLQPPAEQAVRERKEPKSRLFPR